MSIHYAFNGDGQSPTQHELTLAVAMGAVGRATVRPDRVVHVHYVDDRNGDPLTVTAVHTTRGAIHDVVDMWSGRA